MIFGVGETVLDIVFREDQPQTAVPGGSAFNSLISLGRCGLPCAMITQTGDDHVGDMTLDYLRHNGVNCSFVGRCEGMKSHISLAFLDARGDANYSFYKDHTHWQLQPLMEIAERIVFAKEDALILSSFFAVNPMVRPAVRELLLKAHDAGAMIYYDLNYRQPHAADLPKVRSVIEENIRYSTVVRASTDDLQVVQGSIDAEQLTAFLAPEKRPLLIVSSGAGPLTIYRNSGQCISLPTPSITPVSTIGAGDNFNAGFLYGYDREALTAETNQWSDDALLRMAQYGQRFGQEVCRSWNNSIPLNFAKQL